MTERLRCVVIGCRRTRKNADGHVDLRFICGKHWAHVSRAKKRRMQLAGRRWRKLKLRGEQHSRAGRRWADIWWRTFDRACIEAIEAAVGLA